MQPADDALDLLNASLRSAALGTAMELGLFWMLAERPRPLGEIAETLGVPLRRCGYWLQLLVQTGLIEEAIDGFQPSDAARAGILNRFSRDTWAFLAGEARERYPVGVDLTRTLRRGSTQASDSQQETSYVTLMAEDPGRARRFTRMLYELHGDLAREIARRLDMTGVRRLLDVGGGSGVVSQALARKNPGLSAVVVDIANVCEAGREIARENGLDDRVTYFAADFSSDALPVGFDVAIMCDVGIFDQSVFRQINGALRQGGHFAIVDDFAPGPGVAPDSRVTWALARSLADAAYEIPTADAVARLLSATGFRVLRTARFDALGEPDPLAILEAVKE